MSFQTDSKSLAQNQSTTNKSDARVLYTVTQSGRITWISQAKGLGIILVVLGHVLIGDTQSEFLHRCSSFIYMFHMPLFFIISGYLFKPCDPKILLKKRLLSLGVPYLSFLVVMLVHSLRHGVPLGSHVGPHALIHHIIPYVVGGAALTGSTGILWFLTCLLISQNIYNYVFVRFSLRCSSERRLVLFVIGCAFCGYTYAYTISPATLPFSIEAVPMGIVFYWIGHRLSEDGLLHTRRALYFSLIGSASATALFLSFQEMVTFNMKVSHTGVPIMSILFAASLSILHIRIVEVLSNIPIWKTVMLSLGEASLVIMCLHQFVRIYIGGLGGAMGVTILGAILLPYVAFLAFRLTTPTRVLFLGSR